MKKDRHIGAYFRWAACAGILLAAGCTYDDEVATTEVIKSDVVTFGIRMSNEWKPDVIGEAGASRTTSAASQDISKGRSLALPMECVEGTAPVENIYMYVVEEDCPTIVDTMSVRSRAEGDETSSSEPLYGVYAFQVPATEVSTEGDATPGYNPQANGITTFMDNLGLYKNGNYDGGVKYWPGAGSWLQFYAYQPYANANTNTMSITDYSPVLNYTVPDDVSLQKDWAVGSSTMLKGDHLQPVDITLTHIMSKVQVKQGSIAIGKIKSISFSGIKKSGTYSFYGESWTEGNDKQTYSQDFENGYEATGDMIVGSPFHFIPQTLSEEASVNITLEVTTGNPHYTTDNGEPETRTDTYTLTKPLKPFLQGGFQSDKQYTFVITTPQQVDVKVSDKVEGNVKKDLVIKNIGMSPAYIRAAIIGNWVQFDDSNYDFSNQDGMEITDGKRIVAEWKETDGVFDWGKENEHQLVTAQTPMLDVPSKAWIKCSDGFYYYTEVVQPGEELNVKNNNALFKSYTLNDNVAPMANVVLELIVAVHAVYPDDVDLLWKAEIKSVLDNAKNNDGIDIL